MKYIHTMWALPLTKECHIWGDWIPSWHFYYHLYHRCTPEKPSRFGLNRVKYCALYKPIEGGRPGLWSIPLVGMMVEPFKGRTRRTGNMSSLPAFCRRERLLSAERLGGKAGTIFTIFSCSVSPTVILESPPPQNYRLSQYLNSLTSSHRPVYLFEFILNSNDFNNQPRYAATGPWCHHAAYRKYATCTVEQASK